MSVKKIYLLTRRPHAPHRQGGSGRSSMTGDKNTSAGRSNCVCTFDNSTAKLEHCSCVKLYPFPVAVMCAWV